MKTETTLNIKELMIGNLVYDGKDVVEVYNIMDTGDSMVLNCSILDGNIDLYIDKPNPIPLTPEWLEKLGFLPASMPFTGLPGYQITRNGNFMGLVHEEGSKFSIHNPHFTTVVQYVHQVQNFCFAVTQEELKIVL